MNKRFLHIAFNWSGNPKIAEMKPAFDRASDWMRYAPNCWIVLSSEDPQTWYERLKPFLGIGDHMFICALDITVRRGWLPKTTWEWINKKRV
jgi:hypothetical protein